MTVQRQPWAPIDIDVVDKTARIRTLEVQYDHIAKSVDSLNRKVDEVGNKIDKLSASWMDKELSALERKHNKELEAIQQSAEVSSKVKLLWTIGGVLVTSLIAILVAIFKYRFGG